MEKSNCSEFSQSLIEYIRELCKRSPKDDAEIIAAIVQFYNTFNSDFIEELFGPKGTTVAGLVHREGVDSLLAELPEECKKELRERLLFYIKSIIIKLKKESYINGYTSLIKDCAGLEEEIESLRAELKTNNMASCYWCDAKKPLVASPIGILSNALGCCKNCQVLSCGHHAQRDYSKKEYLCFDCDVSILMASAQQIISVADLQVIRQDTIIRAKIADSLPFIRNYQLFSSYKDFKIRRVEYKYLFNQVETIAEKLSQPGPPLYGVLNSMPYDAKLLLIAAAIIINKAYIENEYDAYLSRFMLELKLEVKNQTIN